jgi:hypothetical protein
MTVFIVTYRYHGEPGSGVVGAYASKEAADQVLKLLVDHGDLSKVFEMVVVQDVEVCGVL